MDATEKLPERENPLLWCLRLDGRGGATSVHWEEVPAGAPSGGEGEWVHLERLHPEAERWLREVARVPEVFLPALLEDDVRPRTLREADGLLFVLQTINANPGAEPDDMVSLRIWASPGRLVSLRHRRVRVGQSTAESLRRGAGPSDLGALLLALVEAATDEVERAVESLEERLDELEVPAADAAGASSRRRLVELRRDVLSFHRHLVPQRLALAQLLRLDLDWLAPRESARKARLREAVEQASRAVDELLALGERCKVVGDELALRASEELNRRLYLLSVAAAIFLPVTALAGIMGANVGGIPGAERPNGSGGCAPPRSAWRCSPTG